jgi:hypothetical protein
VVDVNFSEMCILMTNKCSVQFGSAPSSISSVFTGQSDIKQVQHCSTLEIITGQSDITQVQHFSTQIGKNQQNISDFIFSPP